MKKNLKDLFKSTKEQKENTKRLLQTLSLIVGSFFIAEGVISFFPGVLERYRLIGLGLILVIIAVLD